MREVVSRSELSPILSRDRGIISQEVQELIQATLDEYGAGVNIIRLNFDRADPPAEVIDSFREVQAARQERSTLQNRPTPTPTERLAAARGNAAQTVQEAEAYRAQVVNAATGEASRLQRGARGVRQGARRDAQAAVPGDDGAACSATCRCSWWTPRPATGRAWCPTCRSTSCAATPEEAE